MNCVCVVVLCMRNTHSLFIYNIIFFSWGHEFSHPERGVMLYEPFRPVHIPVCTHFRTHIHTHLHIPVHTPIHALPADLCPADPLPPLLHAPYPFSRSRSPCLTYCMHPFSRSPYWRIATYCMHLFFPSIAFVIFRRLRLRSVDSPSSSPSGFS